MLKYVSIAGVSAVAAIVAACAGAPEDGVAKGWSEPSLRPNSLYFETCTMDHVSGASLCLLQGDFLSSGTRVEIINVLVDSDEVADVEFHGSPTSAEEAFTVSVKGIPFTRKVKPLSGYVVFDYLLVAPALSEGALIVRINGDQVGTFDPSGADKALRDLEAAVLESRGTVGM
ncbi:hypothetical protein [Alcanivorax sp. 1008]|uniref:hypothetical protein n=1 Tax=Alcanivorax sp. 1008 TaxID=2816853 RepID=UPI001E010809|nr:hypothetical protein [Alcanivorax sp. 1008]MCC1496801.1 hypothetical protein [Alcanivorax sp. 1008]